MQEDSDHERSDAQSALAVAVGTAGGLQPSDLPSAELWGEPTQPSRGGLSHIYI